ncbi:MAG: indolepyruvate ferredoxin oxidoreductase subunit alpha [Candidatus Methylarchaceae archaeon HK02M2]|nr:indolepyruvate ferredoxin oxidoreductase subunit alpha [Candidatus Methylarchaceae archaeon HK02M2]
MQFNRKTIDKGKGEVIIIDMSEKILLNENGMKIILLGNEAIVRGALESGVGFASTFPGTPTSEIGDTFAKVANKVGIYFEYSTNEKVALEGAAGAALSGVRSTVSFKQYGLNVSSESAFPLAYVGVRAGMVIVVADDPSCWSSAQSEQDSRYYARLGHIPMLEPANSQECKDFTKIAFDLSEKFNLPVFLRLTTRVSHTRGVVTLGRIVKGRTKGKFLKDSIKFRNFPPYIIETHKELHRKLEAIRRISEEIEINFFVNEDVKNDLGIIASGVSFNYVMDALDHLKMNLPVFKLGLTYPIPEEKIRNFIKNLKSILVVEEIEPILEKSINSLAKDVNPELRVFGRSGYLPTAGELTEEAILLTISKITGKKLDYDLIAHKEDYNKLKIARRFPLMCPGCPHRATFFATKSATGEDTTFIGDIGCYILGIFPPFETQDIIFSMGASEGLIHGIKKVSDQKVIAFIGDGTFFHAGIPALINTVFNKSNPLIIILDNRTTAMTGHQPNPTVGVTGMGDQTKAIAIEDIVKACGVENVKVVDSFNVKEMEKTVGEFLQNDKVSVIVAKRECQLLAVRRKRREGKAIPKFNIDKSRCNGCGICLYQLGCPAISVENGVFDINEDLCTGCAVCVRICPKRAIKVVR